MINKGYQVFFTKGEKAVTVKNIVSSQNYCQV